MELQEIHALRDVIVERNKVFSNLGFVVDEAEDLLVFLNDLKYEPMLKENKGICAVITSPEMTELVPKSMGLAVSEAPKEAFYRFHNYLAAETCFYKRQDRSSISGNAFIDPSAYVSDKDVTIGPGTIIEPGAVILDGVTLGKDVIIRAGCTIGSHGFEFKRFGQTVLPITHVGGVLIEDGVELQYNSNVDRAVFRGNTRIGQETKIDVLVHIAHNVRIGKRCLIAAGTVISGSAELGDEVWIGPGSTISSQVHIGSRAQVSLGSVVTKNVPEGQRVSGNFAIDHSRFLDFIRGIR